MEIIIDFINTPKKAKWRMRSGEQTSKWTSYYEGVLVHTFNNGITYGLATDYWNGTLPTWTPFLITKMARYKMNEITSEIEAKILGWY